MLSIAFALPTAAMLHFSCSISPRRLQLHHAVLRYLRAPFGYCMVPVVKVLGRCLWWLYKISLTLVVCTK